MKDKRKYRNILGLREAHTQEEIDVLAEILRNIDYMIECTNKWYNIGAMTYAQAMGMI